MVTLVGLGIAMLPSPPAIAQTVRSILPDTATPLLAQDEARFVANLLTRMSARTRINGRTGFNFVLDTGAGRSAISQDLATALNLPAGPLILVHGISSAELTPTVKISRLAFGGQNFNDVYAGVYSRGLLGADGLLGLDLLSGFELELNMAERTMVLRSSGRDVTEIDRHGVGLASRLSREVSGRTRSGRFGQLILLNAHADGVPIECFVDSGAQYSIGNMALYRALGLASGTTVQRPTLNIYGVTGQTSIAEYGRVAQLEINQQRLGPTPLLFSDLHVFDALDMIENSALLIGADVLYRFRTVAIDFGRGRMRFSGLRRPLAAMVRL